MKKFLTLGIIIGTCMLGFNNCGQFVPSVKSLLNAASTCLPSKPTEKTIFSTELSPPLNFDREIVCNLPANYQCLRRDFRPDTSDSELSEQVCLSTGWGDFCLNLAVKIFDTSRNRLDPTVPSSAFNAGERYNHSEYQCFNTQILVNDLAVFSAESRDLATTLNEVRSKCLNQN